MPATAAAAPRGASDKRTPSLESPTFDPKEYLAVHHATTSFSSLQSELKELQHTTTDKTEQLKALVSAHFDQYLSCHEAVRALADDIRAHQQENAQLVGDMAALKQVTGSTLSVMLQRAREQRRIRNTLAVLHRFRPVFEITTKMKDSLQRQDFEKLAEDYCRLKTHQSKNNIAALQPVMTAAHEVAKLANAQLLQCFDSVSLSVQDQKRALTVLEALGLTDRPTLTCLGKQLDVLERRLAALPGHDSEPKALIAECGALIYRFRSGLWGLICELFEPPARTANSASKAAQSLGITSAEAEAIQQKAWRILSGATELIEKHASPPTAALLKQLNESFRQVKSLKRCPATAALLTTNIAQLKTSFCDKFRIKIVLQFVQQTCGAAREQLETEYFEPVTRLQTYATETSLRADDSAPAPAGASSTTKVARLVTEACDVFDEIRNTSMISSESRIQLYRASVLSVCASDVRSRWDSVWRHVSPVLMELADTMDAEVSGSLDSKTFRGVLVKELTHQLHAMLSSFLRGLLERFSAQIAPPSTMASVAGSARHREGPGVCVLFAIVANCIELREKHLPFVDACVQQLSEQTVTDGSSALRQLTIDVECQCVDKYVELHAEPLQRVLQAGAAEEALQSRVYGTAMLPPSGASDSASGSSSRTDSLRVDSRTTSFAGVGSDGGVSPAALALGIQAGNSIPQDCRQYVFNVLLQLITLRSEVETSLGSYAPCHEYVHRVSTHLTTRLGHHLQDAVGQLEKSDEPSEWRRIHLLVEVRFFLFALRDAMSEDTKIQLVSLERTLEKLKPVSEKAAVAHVQLLSQLKHQTKLYLLALHQR
ncbi:hypothetical protein P43SY_008116 [Pythium insidiosum]|uniref:Exocyst complex component n=1 Tax=Pythium insidiosum TaxID=114742 RepID=A0AAD5M9U3_PYTIN|nr:hypothetical protein P43SY_008116 [Pythium insidiosum]